MSYNFEYKTRPSRQYTIQNARDDMEYLGNLYYTLEAERKALQNEVDQFRCDEYRALHLCKMLQRRIDMLETLLLQAFSVAGQKFMTHQVLTELRAAKKPEAV